MKYIEDFEVMQKSFALNLIEARNAVEMSQQELALYANIDQTSIARFEKGKSNPSLHAIFKLATALNTSVNSLTLIK
jgi:DNA-binding XRE family transcriptional regulator